MSWPSMFLRPDILAFAIPIVGIVVGGVIAVTRMVIIHRERMAMIEQGLDPDRRAESPPADEDPQVSYR